MNLKELRTELASALEPMELNLYEYLPGRAALPSAVVLSGSPYIESGQTFGERLIRFEVWLSVQKGSNDAETDQGDNFLEEAISLLENEGWVIEYVGQPTDWTVNNGQAYTFPIIVTTAVAI